MPRRFQEVSLDTVLSLALGSAIKPPNVNSIGWTVVVKIERQTYRKRLLIDRSKLFSKLMYKKSNKKVHEINLIAMNRVI